jgi:hypothetical protein
MGKLKNLTKDQKEKLSILEPMLQKTADSRNYEEAQRVTLEIQQLLRPTGHETRLMQAKNWLFETAMECGKLDAAIRGFTGIRQKVSKSTRLYLEATLLLAICFLRKRDLKSASPYIIEALSCDKNIKSENRRATFKVELAKRFDEEALLSSLTIDKAEELDLVKIQEEAGKLICEKNENEIFELLGFSVPNGALEFVKEVHTQSQNLLTYQELKRLPSPTTFKEKRKLGTRVISAFQRVVWKSLCDKESDVYKMLFTNGMQAVLDKKYITAAIVATLTGLSIGVYAIAVYITAIFLRMGVDVFCETYRPESIMALRK